MKTVLVTGASSGIGAEIARHFDAKGYSVGLLGRNQERLTSVGATLKNPHEVFVCDLSSDSEVDALTEKLTKWTDTLDILINNAGLIALSPFEETNHPDWARHFEANLFGAFRVTKKALPLLKKGEGRSIVNISSNLGTHPIPNTSIYSASKAAMNNWTQGLASELAPNKIRVNAICPGIVNTPIHAFYGKSDDESKASIEACHGVSPLGRMGEPTDIAQAAEYIAHATWVTGAILPVDGGSNLAR